MAVAIIIIMVDRLQPSAYRPSCVHACQGKRLSFDFQISNSHTPAGHHDDDAAVPFIVTQ
jgi:hypothetical protein